MKRLGERKNPMDFAEFQGLSTETKPGPETQGVIDGATFYELDTGKLWTYSSEHTNPVTSDGWWEV